MYVKVKAAKLVLLFYFEVVLLLLFYVVIVIKNASKEVDDSHNLPIVLLLCTKVFITYGYRE